MAKDNNLRDFFKMVFLVLVIFLLILLLYYAHQVFLLLFASSMLAILWRGTGEWISKKVKISTKISMPVVVVLNFGLVVLAIWLLAPRVSEQVQELGEKIPQTIEQIREGFEGTDFGNFLKRQMPENENMLNNPADALDAVVGFLSGMANVVMDLIVILIIAVFLTINPSMYIGGFLRLIPMDKRKRTSEVFSTLNFTLFRWFVGKIIDMTIVGILTAIGLWIIDIPLVLTFALLAFFLSFIPNIGPILAAIPPILVALLQDPTKAIYVGLLYLGVQFFESAFITPNIQKKAIMMPPVLLLLIQIFFALIMGPLGLLLSTPILAAFMVLVKMLYIEDALGDYSLEVKGEPKG
ncbi:MAG: AI-2E family transporter [Cytophagaceae bacterium]